MNKSIAFIGLGNMGLPMASNLLKSGCQLKVFDLVDAAMDKLVLEGACKASSARAAVNGVDVVISMLPAGKHVQQLYLGEQGLLSQLAPNTLVIDCSTIDSQTSIEVGNGLAKHNIGFIDAPVSGGVGGATAGTLTFIVGGTEQHFAQAEPILQLMGKNIFHAGQLGSGQVAKICNNMLLSVLMTATAEAIQMGVDNGLNPKVLSDIMLQSSGRNWTLELYNPCPDVMPNAPASNNYQGGFMVDLMKKDLGLAMQTANLSQSTTPMGALANSLYKMHSAQGNGQLDFSSIFKLFQH